mmetsp:Transcript_10625/g.14324  ORF Transcript_10625/g.14324 Transcript_10625/m.14324 type:complete len:106 (-) Transcript_10625:124-441(-)
MEGKCLIQFAVRQRFERFLLHMKGLDVKSTKIGVINADGSIGEVEEVKIDLDDRFVCDTYYMTRTSGFIDGKRYQIAVEYSAKILTEATGIYVATDPDTIKKHRE